MPLTITQNSYPNINITAKYYTEPFTSPYYWVIKLALITGNKAWGFEAVHHKHYLKNKPNNVY